MRTVVKIGSTSLTKADGTVNAQSIDQVAAGVAELGRDGREVVVVTSAAIAAGLAPMGWSSSRLPRDPAHLRAASAVGQISLMENYRRVFADHGRVVGQVLLAPTDFWIRNRYLKSRGTIRALLELGAVPVINENDAVADDEIRFGDNDRLAALVAHLVDADRLILLTDIAGLFTADPRIDESASLIEEIVSFDHRLEEMAGSSQSTVGRGGMASKLAAAKMATWSGVETVIANANRPGVLVDAANGKQGVGTVFRARKQRLSARKLWIAFAVRSSGQIQVDSGARLALERDQRSLLGAGVMSIQGSFDADAPVEVVDPNGEVFAKGLVRWRSDDLKRFSGRRSQDLPGELPPEVIHRDDLVMLP